MEITKGKDGRLLVDGEPLVVQTALDEDGLYAEGADLPEAVVEEVLEQERFIRAENQHGELIELWLDMDGQSLLVEYVDPRADAIATLEKVAAEWEQTASRYANALVGERLIVLDKHERAFAQLVQDGRPAIELRLPDPDLKGVTFLAQGQTDKVLAELARLCPENGPFVVRDFQEYAKEQGAKTRELIAQASVYRSSPRKMGANDIDINEDIPFGPPRTSYVVLTLTETGNAAFVDAGRNEEVARIIDAAANKMGDQSPVQLNVAFPLHDLNGNRVGQVEVMQLRPSAEIDEGCVRLVIETGNAAFEEDATGEVARIWRDASAKVRDGHTAFPLSDINGNVVGAYAYQAPVSLERDGVIDMSQAIREGRVYWAEEGYSGLAEDDYRYAVTGPDFEPGYGQGEGEVWLVNAKGEIASGYMDREVVRENMIHKLTKEQLSALKDVIEGRVTFEEHERRLNGDDPELS